MCSVVMYIPVLVVSSVLSSKLCHANAGAVVMVGAIVLMTHVGSRIGALGLLCVLLGAVVAPALRLLLSRR